MNTIQIDTTAPARPSAPELLIEAADTIGNRAIERDNADGERSMARAVARRMRSSAGAIASA